MMEKRVGRKTERKTSMGIEKYEAIEGKVSVNQQVNSNNNKK